LGMIPSVSESLYVVVFRIQFVDKEG